MRRPHDTRARGHTTLRHVPDGIPLVDGKGGNNDQTGVFQRFRSVCAIARLLRAVRIDGPVAVGLVLQIVNVAKFTPANIHAGSEPWHQHGQFESNNACSIGIIDISLPMDANAATVVNE
ncbi:MAG: hypothetical protein ACLS6O_07795 [Bifidobacterium sp.]